MGPARLAVVGILLALGSAARADVVINEVFYHAPDDLDDLQFIELYNPGDRAVDLSGWKLAKGVQYVFPAGTRVEPDGYLVLCKNLQEFKTHYRFDAAGAFTGSLGHGSGTVELRDAAGKRIDGVSYRTR